MDIVAYARQRYTTKAFDAQKRIPDDKIAAVRELLRLSPSSTNAQPWHFILTGSDSGRERITKAMQGPFSYNATKLLNASHAVVLCARTGVQEAHLQAVLSQEEVDGRFATPEARQLQHNLRLGYARKHLYDLKDVQHWMEKQVYIALGALLLGLSTLEIDACAMEGFDAAALDQELGLREQGLTSVLVAALGYRSGEDFNAALPKSRLTAAQVISEI